MNWRTHQEETNKFDMIQECMYVYLIISVVFRRILSPSSPQDCTSIKPFFLFSSDRECNASFLKWKVETVTLKIIKPAHITPAALNTRLLGTEEEAKSANLVEQRQRTLIQYWMGSSGLLSLSDWSVLRAAIESFLRRSKSLANLKRNNQIKSDSLKMLKCNKPCI